MGMVEDLKWLDDRMKAAGFHLLRRGYLNKSGNSRQSVYRFGNGPRGVVCTHNIGNPFFSCTPKASVEGTPTRHYTDAEREEIMAAARSVVPSW